MTISQQLRLNDDYHPSRFNRWRYAIHKWRPCYGFVQRHLTMRDRDEWRNEDGHLVGTDWLGASIQWDQQHRIRYRLWRAYINATQPSTWLKDHSSRPLRRFWTRGRQGWTIEDTWAIDGWLDNVLPSALDSLRKNNHGWPGEPMTFDEWNGDGGIIDQIADGFRAHASLGNLDHVGDDGKLDENLEAELTKRFDNGMALFAKWYGHLWD